MSRSPFRVRPLTVLVAAIAVCALSVGGGAAWAAWTASAQASGQSTTPSVAITQVAFGQLNETYINTHTRLTETGSFTLTNTGTAAGPVAASITAPGSFAPLLPLRIWPVASTAACTAATTIPGTAASGTWASTTVPGVTLAGGASQVYCVRTTVPLAQRQSLATASGAQTVTATLAASLTSSGWTAQAGATTTQATAAIYPLSTDLPKTAQSSWYRLANSGDANACLDVANSGGAGALLISYVCTDNANQRFQIVALGADPSVVTLRPRHAPGTRVSVRADGTQELAAANSAALSQQWIVQTRAGSPTRYQLVSALDGRCLTVRAPWSDAAHTVVDCPLANVELIPTRDPLTFSGGLILTGTFDVGPAVFAQPLSVQRLVGTTWTTEATLAAGSRTVSFALPTITLLSTERQYRLVYPDGSVAFGGIVLTPSLLIGWSATAGTG